MCRPINGFTISLRQFCNTEDTPRPMLNRWFKRRQPDPEPEPHFDPITPDVPVIAIGDIHGRFDLLERLPEPPAGTQVICVGDLVDRGEQSAQVLRALHEQPDIITLMGNHEQMMLKFIDNPKENGPRWLRYGGLQTLSSFGVSGVSQTSSGDDLERARDALQGAMGEALLDWVINLPTSWVSGNVAFVHAAANPLIPIKDQESRTLLWGHEDFGRKRRRDGIWVVHGHTIVDTPTIKGGVVSIDTGAYATDKLTAATINNGEVEFNYL